MGLRGPKPKGKVKAEWSPHMAYCVGLLASDGCLLNDGRHIDLTSSDKEQVEVYRRLLGIENIKIGKKRSGSNNKKVYYRVQFGDVLFYQWLEKQGLHANKSKTLKHVEVPRKYFLDFFRGVFDGDGSVYAFWDTRWKNSYVYWLTITGASNDFLEWLNVEINNTVGVAGYINNNKRCKELRFAKKATRKIADCMYYNELVPKLDRKFAKLSKILNMEKV